MVRGDYKSASELMPTRIELVFDQPKISEMILAVGANSVFQQIKFELIKLAELMSVGGNLTTGMVNFISDQLIQLYPSESISDLKICFQRGSIGQYGPIQRMDGITIRDWMNQYLDEKYKILEDNLMKEKDQYYKIKPDENSDFNWLEEWKKQVKSAPDPPTVPGMTREEIKKFGQEKPVKEKYIPDAIYFIEHEKKLRECQEKTVRERHPEFTDEEVKQYFDNL